MARDVTFSGDGEARARRRRKRGTEDTYEWIGRVAAVSRRFLRNSTPTSGMYGVVFLCRSLFSDRI